MKPNELKYCPGTFAEGFNSYSPGFLRRMFDGKKVSHILNYDAPESNDEERMKFIDNSKRISISGVQPKFSLILEKNQLRLTNEGERGTYILKPIPRDLKKVRLVPANEHLTMQIANQIYNINTAENGMIFFKNNFPAYITRRFDVKEDGSRWGVEDFASLSGKPSTTDGPNFKYDYSYEEVALLIRKFVPAWKVEMEKYFTIVVFNYLYSNGDAHLKNFALLENEAGDYFLSPAYDLINTRIHVDDTDFALDKGLFADKFESETFRKTNHRSKADFLEFARRIGIENDRAEKLIAPFLVKHEKTEILVKKSFMDEPTKRGYLLEFNRKRNYFIKD